MKQYYKTKAQARKAQKLNDPMGNELRIFDMGKKRKVKRFFVGSYIEYLNFAN